MQRVHIRTLMERWARWRIYRHSGGYGKTVMGKALESMPTTRCTTCSGRGETRIYPVCPTCSGSGRVSLKPSTMRRVTKKCPVCASGEAINGTCHRCNGTKRVTNVDYKVNPAFINSTYQGSDDPISEIIDRLVCELRHKNQSQFFVVTKEYCRGMNKTQEDLASEMNLTAVAYRKILQRAHEWIDMMLQEKSRKRA